MELLDPNGQPLSAPRPQPAQDQTPDKPAPPRRVSTAFIVYVQPDGRVIVTDDLDAAIVPSRKPSLDDIFGAVANVQAEITARKAADMAAATTVQTQVVMARQLQEKALHDAVQQELARGTKG